MKNQIVTIASVTAFLILIIGGIIAFAKFRAPQPQTQIPEGSPISQALGLVAHEEASLPASLIASTQPQAQPQMAGANEIDAAAPANPEAATRVLVTLSNNKTFTLALYEDIAPIAVKNFIAKAKAKYYNGVLVFRVDKAPTGETILIQSGDPTNTGKGGGVMQAEYNKKLFTPGSIGVARGQNRDVNSDSQFFIVTQDIPQYTQEYTNFGEVVEGLDVVQEIRQGQPIRTIEVLSS